MVPGFNPWTEDNGLVQYIDFTEPVDEVALALSSVCLRWASEHETDHSTAFNSIAADNVEIGE